MNFEDLSPELQEKVKACTSPEELFELAKDEGVELSEEQLDAVSGGWCPVHSDCWTRCICVDRTKREREREGR